MKPKYPAAKEAVFKALCRLADHKDISEVTVSALIAEAGISRSTFYYHFQNAEDALLRMMGDYTALYAQAAIPVISAMALGDPAEILRQQKIICRLSEQYRPQEQLFLQKQNYFTYRQMFFQSFRTECRRYSVYLIRPDGSRTPASSNPDTDYALFLTAMRFFNTEEFWVGRGYPERPEDFSRICAEIHTSLAYFERKPDSELSALGILPETQVG